MKNVKKLNVTRLEEVTFQTDDETYSGECVGAMNVATENRAIRLMCSGVEKDSKTFVTKMSVTLTALLEPEAYYVLYDFNQKGLKDGIYSYGTDSSGKEVTLLMKGVDELNDTSKLMIFPKVRITEGLSFAPDNDSEDVQKLTLDFTAYPDEDNQFYYEIINTDENEELIEQMLEKYDVEQLKQIGG